jgi:hypothetical protein
VDPPPRALVVPARASRRRHRPEPQHRGRVDQARRGDPVVRRPPRRGRRRVPRGRRRADPRVARRGRRDRHRRLDGARRRHGAALLAQTAGLHAPSDVHIVAFVGPATRAALADLKWLPHTWAAEDALGTAPIADNAATASRLLAELEELVDTRTKQLRRLRALKATDAATAGRRRGGRVAGREEEMPLPAYVVIITPTPPSTGVGSSS